MFQLTGSLGDMELSAVHKTVVPNLGLNNVLTDFGELMHLFI